MVVISVMLLFLSSATEARAAVTQLSQVATLNPGTNNVLQSVACPQASECLAVGNAVDANGFASPLVQRWNGSAWSLVGGFPAESDSAALTAIACGSQSMCMAVGRGTVPGETPHIVAAVWDGTTWTTTAASSPGSFDNALTGVACPSVTSCIAVGSYTTDGHSYGLAEVWAGGAWSITPTPDSGATQTYLQSIACTSSTTCFAVGYETFAGALQPVVEIWDGNAWTVSASPTMASDTLLTGVACPGPTSCIAVGYSYVSGTPHPYILRFDGSVWQPDPATPSSPTESAQYLEAVSCVSEAECLAVGFTSSTALATYALSFDGVQWAPVTTSTPNPAGSFLLSTACAAPAECMAVGYTFDTHGLAVTLAERSLALPTSTDQCKNDQWRQYHRFKNQGECLKFVRARGPDGRAFSPA
jgi:hypothetical protein